jgi:predicted transcriptional regulator
MTPTQLRDWRERVNMSQRDAAACIGCSRRALQKWETGDTIIPLYIESNCAFIERIVTVIHPVQYKTGLIGPGLRREQRP